jgi:hypothetical protein
MSFVLLEIYRAPASVNTPIRHSSSAAQDALHMGGSETLRRASTTQGLVEVGP